MTGKSFYKHHPFFRHGSKRGQAHFEQQHNARLLITPTKCPCPLLNHALFSRFAEMNRLRSISEVAPLLREGKITPRELVEECLARIEKFEPSVRAWVLVDAEKARQAADEAGWRISRGEYRGLLDGVPLGIKDIIDVAGWPTKAGSPTREKHLAISDAPLVATLRQAGAIILGKTVTVEFACFDPSPTRNPWSRELKHTPGGSSSGSAAALALGMCYGSIGTQTGGSLVRPSSYCGTATLKPTFGRLSREGIVPVSYHLDHPGPMARTVADLRILYECLLHAEPEMFQNGCHWRSASAAREEQEDKALSENKLPNPKVVGTLRVPLFADGTRSVPATIPATYCRTAPKTTSNQPTEHWRNASGTHSNPQSLRLGLVEQLYPQEADDAVQKVFDKTLSTLRANGAEIVPVTLPGGFGEVLPMHRRIMGVEAAEYHRETFAAHREMYGPKIASLLDEGLTIAGVDYAAALAWQREWSRRVAGMFAGVDALVMPSTDTPAPATLETTGTPKFQAPWSCAGVPAVSIPCGLSDDGMPIGLQIIGPHESEWELLEIASWCEGQVAFNEQPLMLGE
jgi:Asp-tRNA(Asn)/Glu-tRNA(Gln) amidotransferase A subunit family amidase